MDNQPPLSVNPYAPPAAAIEPGAFDFTTGETLARPGTRLGAKMLDQLLLMFAVIPGGILTTWQFAVLMNPEPDAQSERATLSPLASSGLGIALIAAGLLAISIYQWYLIATTGRTLGKRWCGIKVVRIHGDPVDFVSGVVLREWVFFALQCIPLVGSAIGLIDALSILRSDHRCFHDQLAGTKVIVAP